MISLSATAQEHFRKLIEQQALPGLGIRLRAIEAGTPRGDCQLEFSEPSDRDGSEWEVECEGYSLFVDAESVPFLDGATIDYDKSTTGGQLTIRAPALRGAVPSEDASVVERVRYVIESEINPQLASHGGRVSLREVTADGVVVLQFGGGCHGCGMVDATLRGGVERTLKQRIPEVTGVADATDHASGTNPYMRREAAARG
ncbi:NfuA family Fe-S biogenesis protein [Dokdonella sp.]|uniref:NfuA family Fe-S biogenesis protein n=1 Tax=Dokdonella sp. TaxID=2291710 RepID=UPI001B0F09B3|nr:NfuA family Fe-S biogenesis protein [Dokdonella sp.]MBO9663383.1 NfuA family Fe-S biogenesis protein [Dokdonella sp.]